MHWCLRQGTDLVASLDVHERYAGCDGSQLQGRVPHETEGKYPHLPFDNKTVIISTHTCPGSGSRVEILMRY